jgi:putative transposon-encoded protein
MSKTTIVSEIENVVIKKVGKGAGGAYGLATCPKAWIGKTVYVVLKVEEK